MFGQFSAMGSHSRSKRSMLAIIAGKGFVADATSPEFQVTNSRKWHKGKNRLFFECANGDRHFLLHETLIASVTDGGTRLTLRDGGWATPTTRRAWDDALRAFGLGGKILLWGARPVADHVANHSIYFDREITLTLPDLEPVPGTGHPALMIRAIGGEDPRQSPSLTVEYRDGVVISSAGERIKVGPFHLMVGLHQLLAIAKRGNGRYTLRGRGEYYLYDTADHVLGWECYAGCGGRSVFVGCHQFNTADVRSVLRRLEALHPDKVKEARARFRKLAKAKAQPKPETSPSNVWDRLVAIQAGA